SNPDTGKRVVLFLLGPGDGFDILTLLDGRPHEAEATALDPLELLSAPIEEVRRWICEHPAFNRRFLPYVGDQLRRMETLASDLALLDTASRLARLILRHIDPQLHKDHPHGLHPVKLIADLNHESLGHMVGSVRQVVNRHLQGMRRSGIIHGGRGEWVIKDLEALKHQAGVTMHRLRHDRETARDRH
ncbi:MAG TPA: Crp/Fnr family transcriptional regulator, partial [Sedimenticola sp.]|nr:Crp/Fnr family transcriptional regulator [Sedimenticola sp.]